ncbi:MAG TPA: AsmA-like C-terminal region-containing protein [Paenirhodobacter sp.]
MRSTVPRRRPRVGIWALIALPFAALVLVFAFFAVTHRPIPVPQWVMAQIEARANAMLSGRLQVAVMGQADLVLDAGLTPRVLLRAVRLSRPDGRPLALLPELRMGFVPGELLHGKAVARSFTISGATIVLRRLEDGRIDLDLGGDGAFSTLSFADAGAVTQAVEAAFETPALRGLEQVTAGGVRIRIDDRRLDRVWEVSDGGFHLTQDDAEIALALGFSVGEADRTPAQIALSASTSKTGPEADFVATVADIPAEDLAMQSPAVALLGLLDAPISGRFHTAIDASGALTQTEATLSIGKGALRPAEGAPPVPFDSATMSIGYDADAQKVILRQSSFQSAALRFHAEGETYLRDFSNGLPGEALVQMRLTDIEADPEGMFVSPARFSFGAAEGRIRLSPFRAEIGQLQLVDEGKRISAKGTISAASDGWRVALDAGVGQIDQHDLLALWPPRLVPPTRNWLAENVVTGQLHNARAAMRIAPGQPARFELGYEFRGAEVTIIRTLPPVREGRGFASMHDNTHALMVEEGAITAPSGGQVEVADSVMRVPDITEKPARAEITLVTRSGIPAALSILDQPPFQFLTKAGKGTDLAEGQAEAHTNLRFRMEKKIAPEDVDFDVSARMTDVRSDKVVPGRVLRAPELILKADRSGMTISGKGLLDAVLFDGRWSQVFGPEHKGKSRVDGYANITPEALESLKIALPKGMLSGAGWGRIGLDLTEGAPTAYEFRTDLKGIGLSIPEIKWSKPAAPQGDLTLRGHLRQPPTVEAITLQAPGLQAQGSLTLSDAGMDRASFDRLVIGNWFDGAADLISQGKGRAPDVALRGGTLDLRRAPFGDARSGGGTGGTGGGTSRFDVSLDRLVVSDSIALTTLRGNFTARSGFAGDFAARVNGYAQVEGIIGPAANGRTAVRITSPDAGAVLASAGITDKTAGGALALTLSPIGQASYEGNATANGLRVTDAPILASMLSAVSIVGLVEQLNGEGLVFSNVDAAFRLTPDGVSITSAEATGVSMGVTLKGNFYPKSGQIDMEGVVSPFYIVNSIGQIFARKGEGLFGFTYTVHGPAKAPQVSVNPFSILTPGALRDIFRRVPPTIKAQ